jgi:hypothetical protein
MEATAKVHAQLRREAERREKVQREARDEMEEELESLRHNTPQNRSLQPCQHRVSAPVSFSTRVPPGTDYSQKYSMQSFDAVTGHLLSKIALSHLPDCTCKALYLEIVNVL